MNTNNLSPTYLQQTHDPIVSYKQCSKTNGGFLKEDTMICVGALAMLPVRGTVEDLSCVRREGGGYSGGNIVGG